MQTPVRSLFLFALTLSAAEAATFSLGATIRAGIRGGQDWEIGLGAATPYSAAVTHATPYFRDNEEYDFTLRYTGATNRAELSVDTNPGNGPADVAAWNPTGGVASTAGRLWTFNSLFVSAAYSRIPPMPRTEIEVKDLALGPGIDIVAGLSTTDLRARQEGAAVLAAIPQPVVFRTRNGSGDWLLSGTIRMRGLASEFPSGAQRSHLQFVLNSTSADLPAVPEPGTYAMLLSGGAMIAVLRRRKR